MLYVQAMLSYIRSSVKRNARGLHEEYFIKFYFNRDKKQTHTSWSSVFTTIYI